MLIQFKICGNSAQWQNYETMKEVRYFYEKKNLYLCEGVPIEHWKSNYSKCFPYLLLNI